MDGICQRQICVRAAATEANPSAPALLGSSAQPRRTCAPIRAAGLGCVRGNARGDARRKVHGGCRKAGDRQRALLRSTVSLRGRPELHIAFLVTVPPAILRMPQVGRRLVLSKAAYFFPAASLRSRLEYALVAHLACTPLT